MQFDFDLSQMVTLCCIVYQHVGVWKIIET